MRKTLPILLLFCSFAAISQEAIPLKGDEIFGSINARQIGPALMSGRVNDLELHPTDPKIVYVGTAGGGIWKSQDGGVTYRSVFDKHIQ
ncbi:MAG: xyloglucanase precursor, partial [Spirosomataceae bacterium]